MTKKLSGDAFLCTLLTCFICFRGKFVYSAEKIGPRDICELIESLGFQTSVVNNKDGLTRNILEHKSV